MSDIVVVDGIEYDFHVRKNNSKTYIAVYQSGYPHTLFLSLTIDYTDKEAYIESLDCQFDVPFNEIAVFASPGEQVKYAIREAERV